jgi:hypothetical protein
LVKNADRLCLYLICLRLSRLIFGRGAQLKEEAPRPVFLKESIIKEDERLVEDIFSGFAKDSQPGWGRIDQAARIRSD